MPTIRISDEHYLALEGLAVKRTSETQTLISRGQALAEILDSNFPSIKIDTLKPSGKRSQSKTKTPG